MKRFLQLALFFLLVNPAWAAIAFVKEVQQWSFVTASSTDTITLGGNVAAGNFVAIPYETNAASLSTAIVDSPGNTCAVVTAANSANNAYSSGVLYCLVASGYTSGISTITITWDSAALNTKFGDILEFSGVATSSPENISSFVNDTFTGGAVSIPVTTTNANDVIIAIVAQQHARVYTVGGSFTNVSNQTQAAKRSDYLYRIVSATGTYDPAGSISATDNYRGSIASFKQASGAAACGNFIALLGAGCK